MLFKNLWRGLSENHITQYGIEPKGRRPHITIADYDSLDIAEFRELFNKFYEDKSKIDLCLNIIGSFINTGTLFLSPTLTIELLDFHRDHHEIFKAFYKNENSLYLPGRWSPHCTIASRLSEEEMIQGFGYCKTNLDKVCGKLSEVALIEIQINDMGIAVGDRVMLSKELK
jgi:2'-5' RNA ligase